MTIRQTKRKKNTEYEVAVNEKDANKHRFKEQLKLKNGRNSIKFRVNDKRGEEKRERKDFCLTSHRVSIGLGAKSSSSWEEKKKKKMKKKKRRVGWANTRGRRATA